MSLISECKNHENLAFLQILPLLYCHENMGSNFKNPHSKNLHLNVKNVSSPPKIVLSQNRFYSGPSQNTIKIITFFRQAEWLNSVVASLNKFTFTDPHSSLGYT